MQKYVQRMFGPLDNDNAQRDISGLPFIYVMDKNFHRKAQEIGTWTQILGMKN